MASPEDFIDRPERPLTEQLRTLEKDAAPVTASFPNRKSCNSAILGRCVMTHDKDTEPIHRDASDDGLNFSFVGSGVFIEPHCDEPRRLCAYDNSTQPSKGHQRNPFTLAIEGHEGLARHVFEGSIPGSSLGTNPHSG